MSSQELDSLFKNKLDDFEKKPSSHLWSKIDRRVQQPGKRRFIWLWSAAAALILLALISIFLYNNQSIETKPELANSDQKTLNTPSKELKKAAEPLKENAITKTLERNNQLLAVNSVPKETSKQEKEVVAKPVMADETKEVEEIEVEKEEKLEEVIIEVSEIENIAKNDATDEEHKASKKIEKGRTLVFDISQFTKEETLANTEGEEKSSKLRQILKFAKDVKEGESGLGELRKAKNQLFALNKKKENNGK